MKLENISMDSKQISDYPKTNYLQLFEIVSTTMCMQEYQILVNESNMNSPIN